MLLTIFLLICALVNIRAFFKCLSYKLQYGEKAIFLFFPFLGIIGHQIISFILYRDIFTIQKNLVNKYPKAKIIVTNMLLESIIVLVDPEMIKEFSQRINDFHKRIILPDILGLNFGLLFAEGLDWKKKRSILAQSFSIDELKNKCPKIKDITQQRVQNKNLEDENVNLNTMYSQITGEVVIQTFFGSDPLLNQLFDGRNFGEEVSYLMGEQFSILRNFYYHYKIRLFRNSFYKIFPTKRETQFAQRIERIIKIIEKLVLTRVTQHQQEKDSSKEWIYFIDIYIDYFIKNKIAIDKTIINQITNEFMTVFFAGTDTTAHLLAGMSYCLACHPEIQDQIINEFKQNNIDFENIQLKSFQNLTITQNLINESLRLYPPAAGLFLRKSNQNTKIQDIEIPKGQLISVLMIVVMSKEQNFKNPNQFDLSRWDKDLQSPFNFTPFSAGPRHCIGQHLAVLEAKIIIGIILKNYQLEKIEGKQIKLVITSTYEFQDDNLVKFKRRKREELN